MPPRISDHYLYPLYCLLTVMKAAGNLLCEPFDPVFLLPLDILFLKAWEDVFLVQAV